LRVFAGCFAALTLVVEGTARFSAMPVEVVTFSTNDSVVTGPLEG
jgi:hypothetical protein